MAKVWVKSYDAEVKTLAESYYYRAFRRKIPDRIDSVIFLPKKQFVQKCVDSGTQNPPHDDTLAFLYPKEFSDIMFYRIYLRRGYLDDALEDIGHELFHVYLDIEDREGRADRKRLEDYVIEEAFAHLGSRFYHDQFKGDPMFKETYPMKDFKLTLPRDKEHRRAYKLTNALVQKFYPRYFTPVKRILLESSIADVAKISGIPEPKLRKT